MLSVDLDLLEDRLHREAVLRLEKEAPSRRLNRERVRRLVWELLQGEGVILPRAQEEELVENVVNRILGLGPLEPLLQDPEITEIMVNGPDAVFIERNGRLERVPVRFRDEQHLLQVIDRIVAPLGRRVDESMPYVDARLPDGSRVNVIIRPLAVRGPALTIRKFSATPFTLKRLVRLGTLTEPMARFLQACVRARLNILVSGGTGAGKTSTLNALARAIPPGERIITIEDTAELQLKAENLVSLEARPPNIEGKGEVTIRTLVRNALRMRPDRIIVGEVRGPEAFDMLQAMNTGHPGSMTTIHANSPADAVRRLESMVLMAGLELPQPTIREYIASAIHVIVQQERLPDGRRRMVEIVEVHPEEGPQGRLRPRLVPLFRFERRGLDETGRVLGDFVTLQEAWEASPLREHIRRAGFSVDDPLEEG